MYLISLILDNTMTISKTFLKGDKYHWECFCGNDTMSIGFQTCNDTGDYIEPTRYSNWSGLYACQSCGRIIAQDTREVIGQNLSAYRYDEFLKERRN